VRDRLHAALEAAVPGLVLDGHPEQRLPKTLNVSFPDCDGEALLAHTPSVAAATGSACHSGRTERSSARPSEQAPASPAGRTQLLGLQVEALG
jgi:cysteine desulfurase